MRKNLKQKQLEYNEWFKKWKNKIKDPNNPYSMRQFSMDLKTIFGKKNMTCVSPYSDEVHPRMAYIACAEMGAKDMNLSELFGIHIDTLMDWKRRHKKFRQYIKAGKDKFDTENVEKILVKRALGYKTKTTKITYKGGQEESRIVEIKEVPGDVKAAMFWLRNRMPERWPELRDIAKLNAQRRQIADDKRRTQVKQIGEEKASKMTEAAAGVAKVLIESGVIDLEGKIRKKHQRSEMVIDDAVDAEYTVEDLKEEEIKEE